MSGDTWGAYLRRNIVDLREVREALAVYGGHVSFVEAAMFRELAMLRSSFAVHAEAAAEERDGDDDAWRRGETK